MTSNQVHLVSLSFRSFLVTFFKKMSVLFILWTSAPMRHYHSQSHNRICAHIPHSNIVSESPPTTIDRYFGNYFQIDPRALGCVYLAMFRAWSHTKQSGLTNKTRTVLCATNHLVREHNSSSFVVLHFCGVDDLEQQSHDSVVVLFLDCVWTVGVHTDWETGLNHHASRHIWPCTGSNRKSNIVTFGRFIFLNEYSYRVFINLNHFNKQFK